MVSQIKSFMPVVDSRTRILILGSVPGIVSLEAQQYYANPRNVFWRLMGEILGIDINLSYQDRTEQLLTHRVGLWDVVYRCKRKGSLDSSIESSTVRANHLDDLFAAHEELTAVVFNGKKAAELYKRHCDIGGEFKQHLSFYTMPSTSPANAACSYSEKLFLWSEVIRSELARPN